MKKVSLLLSLLLALTMLTGMVAPAMAEAPMSTPLVVGEGNFSQKFSPFFSDSVYDSLIVSMTQLGMMTLDRAGNIVFNGIEGETIPFEGVDYTYYTNGNISVDYDKDADITTYTYKLREGMVFADGVPVTIDDIIFMMYVYFDNSYAGSTSLKTYPIIGLQNYQTQTTDDVYAKYNEMFDAIYAAGPDHVCAEGDAWTQEQEDGFWAALEAIWIEDVQAISNYVFATYAAKYAEDTLGVTAEEVGKSEGLKTALGMALWGFGDVGEDGVLTGAVTGKTWTLEGEDFPTAADYYAEVFAAYEGDPVAYWDTENGGTVDGSDVLETARSAFIGEWGPQDEGVGEGGIPNVAGVKKLDDYTVEIKTKGFSAPAVYSILGHSIPPMHYYGDADLYDYENNMFGFPRGDISIVESNTSLPMGGGAYNFVSYDNKVVYLEANPNFWAGEPKTKYLQFKETNNPELIPGIQTGTIDLANINGSKKDFAQVAENNSNGEITGDVITTSLVNNRGYGYIGINADRVRVGTDSFSDASKNVRKALATMLAVYRDVAYDSYYADAAVVINYPITNTSWAAPQATDEGYKVAFSVDAEGNDIYTSEMSSEEKYVAALEAAKGFLIAAGYTFDDATGKFIAAPEGASMSYEITVGAGGSGDHPSFSVMTDASNALAQLGITLKINDLSNTATLWEMLDAGTADLWAAAWQNNNPDPDMYQTYYSTNIYGMGGTDSNHYHVAIKELDDLIMEGRNSSDQTYRKAIYKQALDIIVDSAVEVPCYQRQNAILYSSQRIETMTPGITTWWDWYGDIETITMAAAQ